MQPLTSSVSASEAPHQSPFALIVDRDADTRRMYAEYLSLANYRIEEAADGRDALALVLANRPDILVMETRLPGISGYDLCSLLRNDAATQSLPIVIVTGDAFEADLRRARNAGADAVLVKPCLPEQLLVEVGRLLAQSVELRERGAATRAKVEEQLARADRALDRSRHLVRPMLSHIMKRHDTTAPPLPPPQLVCPACDQPLKYVRSHIGGVS